MFPITLCISLAAAEPAAVARPIVKLVMWSPINFGIVHLLSGSEAVTDQVDDLGPSEFGVVERSRTGDTREIDDIDAVFFEFVGITLLVASMASALRPCPWSRRPACRHLPLLS
jgi:hypothetical protein